MARPTPSRVLLQRRAPQALRRHLVRGVSRIAILFVGDAMAFLGVRALVRGIRDGGAFGEAAAGWLGLVVPSGFLGGWQFPAALGMGLIFSGAYGRGDARRDTGRVFKAVTLAAALALWASVWRAPSLLHVGQFGATVLAMWGALSMERGAVDRVVRWVFGKRFERAVFVADRDDAEAHRVYQRLDADAAMALTEWVYVPSHGRGGDIGATVDRMWDALNRTRADTVVLCGEFSSRIFEAIVESSTAGGVRVLSVSRYDGVTRRRTGLVWHGSSAFAELTVPALQGWQLAVKRALDLAASAVGLMLLAPLFGVIAAAIKLDSRGPVFFSQERVGYAGRVFRVFKFRTMRDGSDAEKTKVAHLNHTGDSRLFKIPDDPRVTSLGRFLRRWSLDELPQLWNVLVGSMSLVGPRPFFESDLEDYLDHHYARLGAKPGITGLWQVMGRSAIQDFEEVVRLDREYIDRWSLLLDLTILARTAPAVLRRIGAF